MDCAIHDFADASEIGRRQKAMWNEFAKGGKVQTLPHSVASGLIGDFGSGDRGIPILLQQTKPEIDASGGRDVSSPASFYSGIMKKMKKPKLNAFPAKPGVYIMKDKSGAVLYVGKAGNLKNRLRSYFLGSRSAPLRRGSEGSSTGKPYFAKASNFAEATMDRSQGLRQVSGSGNPKIQALIERTSKVEWIETNNETEALLLENNLIKKHRPPFNIIMRDDKNYLYVRITIQENFPQILLARKVLKDGAKYFGPYASSGPVYEVMKLIKRAFPLCTGKPDSGRPYSAEASNSANRLRQTYFAKATKVKGATTVKKLRWTTTKGLRACMNYHLKICPGVCVGKVKAKEYRKTIDQVIRFLQGNYPSVIQGLKKQMAGFSARKEFERAARIRDGLKAIKAINERQSVVRADLSVSEDAIGIARQLNKALVVLLQVRSGALINQQQYALDSKYEAGLAEILAGFLRDYYAEAADLPKKILLPEPVDGAKAFAKWLTELAGRRIVFHIPTRGRQKALVKLAQSNAEMKFSQLSSRWRLEKVVATEGVEWLKNKLKLKKLERIEAYDISNLQGTDAVGAMVVWERPPAQKSSDPGGGAMDKKQYRRFKIKSVEGPNDFASLAEVLSRRFAHGKSDAKFARLPDVVLIDGGKGQVSTITRALKDHQVAVIGIAKGSHSRTKAKAAPRTQRGSGDDLILASGTVILPDNSPTKMLLQNIRDEAHRFALSYHTNLRKKRTTSSNLEKISGIGPATRRKLIKTFGSMATVKEASLDKLTGVVGKRTAEKIKNFF